MNDFASSSPAARHAAAGSGPAPGQNPLDWARETGAAGRVMTDLDLYLRRRQRRRWQVAGATAVLLLGLGAAIWPPWQSAAPTESIAVGGRAVVLQPTRRALPDGTAVELKPGATIEISYSGSQRRVVLRGGAAHFAVTKDAARPFVVAADGLEARAVGTAFMVDPAAGGVAVLVTEGRVAVTRSAAPAGVVRPAPLAIVSAGEGVRVALAASSSQAIEPVPAAEIPALLAWRVPRLEFSDTPLARVVAMFNTHGSARLVLDEGSVGALKVSGVLRADDVESLFRLVEVEFALQAERREGAWHLRRR